MGSAPRIGYAWDLLGVLVSKELKLRYRGTTFGFLWSLGNPLILCAVLYFAFRKVFRLDIENYAVFLLSALFAWQWLTTSLGVSSNLFLANSPLVRKLPFPHLSLCLALVLGDLFHFLVTLPVFAGLMLVTSDLRPSPIWLVGIPVLAVVQASFLFGGVVVISTANALFRDLEQLVRVGLLLLFYVTPVLYPVSMVPEGWEWSSYLNPVAPIVVAWRLLLYENTLGLHVLAALGWAGVALLGAWLVHRAIGWRLPELV